jgi:hypothetical protein
MNEAQTSYVPGVCNINPAEIAYRRKWKIGGLGLAAVLFVGLLFTTLNPVLRSVIVLLPLLIGASNYLQVKNKFCVSLGASGLQNATPGSPSASEVAGAASRQTDKQKASSMNRKALAFTVVICVLTALIPNFTS